MQERHENSDQEAFQTVFEIRRRQNHRVVPNIALEVTVGSSSRATPESAQISRQVQDMAMTHKAGHGRRTGTRSKTGGAVVSLGLRDEAAGYGLHAQHNSTVHGGLRIVKSRSN